MYNITKSSLSRISKLFSFKFLEGKPPQAEAIFTNIYKKNAWWTGETHSGPGSNLLPTQIIREEIVKVIQQFNIASLLDIPCGDFHWMQKVPLDIQYIGADVVKELIEDNQQKYQNEKRNFIHCDIIRDDLPQVDLILCRDCLVHFPNEQIWQALTNIKRSGSKYLLATSHIKTTHHTNIQMSNWQPLNLLAEPFNLPTPLLIISEGLADKSLLLWNIQDINI
jgi:SAM-dependent methyltransferase